MATENDVVGVEMIAPPPPPAAAYESIVPPYEKEEEEEDKKKKQSKRHRTSPPPPPVESSAGYRFSYDEDEGDAKRRQSSKGQKELAALTIMLISRGAFDARGVLRRDRDLPPPPPPETKVQSYVCYVCGKAFPTPQALGGHMTSHGRKPAAAGITAVSTSTGGGPAAAAGKKSHECPKCHRSFPTGQGLGGHMRRHFAGVIGSGAADAAADAGSAAKKETGAAALLTEKSKKDLGFDLNEPATPLVLE